MRAMSMLDQAQAQHNDMLRKRRILVQDKEKLGKKHTVYCCVTTHSILYIVA